MIKYLAILVLMVPVYAFSQPSHGEEAYRNFIRKFYYHLTEDDTVTVKEASVLFNIDALEWESYLFNAICDIDPDQAVCQERRVYGNEWSDFTSIFFSELRANINRFTDGYGKKMDSIVEYCAEIYDEGSTGIIAIDIYFPNGYTVYFLMNRYPDEPIYIGDIYFGDGSSIYNYLSYEEDGGSKKYLKRLAIINDTDGYSNVRKGKGLCFTIVGKIDLDEVFMFTPNYYDDWWRVRNVEGTLEGYMHKSRIVPYGKVSAEKKLELKF